MEQKSNPPDHRAQISIITAIAPTRLSKGFELDAAGGLVKAAGGILSRGRVETRAVDTLANFAAILTSLTPSQALIYGVPIHAGALRVLTRRAFDAAGDPADATTRTNDTFRWPDGAGVLMLDYDPPPTGEALDRGALVQAIRDAAPGLADAALLWWPSASSCIWSGDREMRGVRGQRLYLLAQDAGDIPRAGAALVARLWLAGHGRIEISASGALLERTLVDASVWQPSRLDFAGGAACAPGLDQRRGDPVVIAGAAEIVDTRLALPDLTAAERARLDAIKAEAKGAEEPEAAIARTAWIEARTREMVAKADRNDPQAIKRAETVARRALEERVLAGDFVFHVVRGAVVTSVTVKEALDDRARFHGCLTRDPLEPDYDGGRAVGRLFLMQGRPTLHSFAHGGATYRLLRAPARTELVKGKTAEAAAATIDLLRRDPSVFDFGGQLAIVDGGRVHPLCEHALAHHLADVTQFWKWAASPNGGFVQTDCDPSPALLKQITALGDRRALKALDAVVTAPTIRLDGSVLDAPGYDPATRLVFDPLACDAPDVPKYPTINQARAALDVLMNPFETFPFVDANAAGAMLAALLTAAVRPVLPTSPAFAFDAPVQGSGKTLLASCIGALIEGCAPDVWPHTQGRDDEETRKRLFTALRTGTKTLIWDNVTGTFDSAAMAGFITAPAMIDRVLGKSEAIRIPNRALLIFTGNNLTLAGDMPRRVIICRIDPKTDQPFARCFSLDPLQHVLDNRLEMTVAACTLIRARFTHMTEAALGRLASFEDWDNLVRQTVVWADRALAPGRFGDPMDLVREAQGGDPDADALYAALTALHDCFGDAEISARDVLEAVKRGLAGNPLATALADLAGERALTSVRTLGRVFKMREGRIVRGLRLMGRHDAHAGARVYRVEIA